MSRKPDTYIILDQASGYLQLDILEAAKAHYAKRAIIAGTLVERSVKRDSQTAWDRIIPYDRSSTWRRFYTWMVATLQMGWIVARKYRKAHILAITNPPLSVFVPWLLGCRYDILVYDVYPDAMVNYGYLRARNPVVRLWRWLNTKAFHRAERMFTLSQGMKDLVAQYVGADTIDIVPLWTDNEFIQPIPKEQNRFLADKPYREKFLIVYAGNMGQTHPVEVLVDLAKRLDPERFQVLLIGGGHKWNLIRQLLEAEPVANVSLLPWQSVDILPHVLSAADVSVVTLDKEASALSVPSKTFNSLSVGNPILAIASPQSELARLLHTYQCGATFEAAELEKMAAFLEGLAGAPEQYREMAANSLQASLQFTSENAKAFFKNRFNNTQKHINMDAQPFLQVLATALEITDRTLDINDRFRDYPEWDSLNRLNVIAALDEAYGVTIEEDRFDRLHTIRELMREVEAVRG